MNLSNCNNKTISHIWTGFQMVGKKRIYKYLLNGLSTPMVVGNTAILMPHETTIFAKNCKKYGINPLVFKLTDKQFGLINISYGKPATMHPFIKSGGLFVSDGFRSMAIPVTKYQLKLGAIYFNNL